MPSRSSADHSVSPPIVRIPRDYNAAYDLIERNLAAGGAARIAYIDDAGQYSFGQLAERVDRFGSGLQAMGLETEHRVLLALADTIDFPTAFLGAIKAGMVPVAVNTLLTPKVHEYMLSDSRARALVVSQHLVPQFAPLIGKLPFLKHVIVSGGNAQGHTLFKDMIAKGKPELAPAPTTCDDPCFWLYSSGSTGMPKGTVHVHSSLILTAELYAKGVLGCRESDVVLSAAKLFFAYGLGNSLSFTLAAGAAAILMAERPTPASVFKRLTESKPTIFYGVPTLYAAMLASPDFPKKGSLALRLCVSAGEALPPQIAKSWKEKTGVEILDGIGSTEMLHIFLSNRPNDLRYGTTGKPVPGYELRLVDEHGNPVKQGEMGELQISGPTSAACYWNNHEKSRNTFMGGWTKSGDKYSLDKDGYYVYGGRSDDMLKVSGIYVSPAEVEAALITHEAVLEAAVVGAEDESRLIKPKAFVVLKQGNSGSDALKAELRQHVKDRLAPYKYPRWIVFLPELPKTATGKIQRFKLRG
ncbi:MAG TPA: benzoate-CoA ligase family protein [Burkholderiales bacterium]|nr:benzoate-CoA ligase family protein [Burkholderiales bacterium]